MPLYNPPGTASMSGPVGFFGATPVTQPSGYSWQYSANSKILPPYVALPATTAYTGGLLDLLQAARLTDLNALRLAVENLRVFTEALAQQHNAISLDMKTMGLINT